MGDVKEPEVVASAWVAGCADAGPVPVSDGEGLAASLIGVTADAVSGCAVAVASSVIMFITAVPWGYKKKVINR